MSQVKKSKYTAEFRLEAVKLVTEQGLGVSEAARRSGMPMQSLAAWASRAKNGKINSQHVVKKGEFEACPIL